MLVACCGGQCGSLTWHVSVRVQQREPLWIALHNTLATALLINITTAGGVCCPKCVLPTENSVEEVSGLCSVCPAPCTCVALHLSLSVVASAPAPHGT